MLKETKILLVDDEPDITEFIGFNLENEGYLVEKAQTGEEAIEKAKIFVPDLIILDVMMPGMDGMETCEKLRNIPALNNPVIAFLTARSEDYSQIAGFDAGADDYISKPVKPKVLISRVKALLKRKTGNSSNDSGNEDHIVEIGSIVIDKERYIVKKDTTELILPRKEFELLLLLASKPDKVFTRDEIYARVWGEDIIVGDRTIDVHIRKLREKLGSDHIRTIKGVGYKFLE
ncbi:MAG TPA: DNA-binding response regulator [Marinilabiliales bacterium]|jgi:two-component system alkaline phosphatase synthesis response regulator PhoP|nr:MAG: DNA-binding response regulator [Bacteroidetes bacterium GWC2_40_13]OFX74190.1 MAG: DNA-binding response regulator [Bacteroidetes bacterium GWD2_40_43]OFX92976.1 MAG: DNA-binding response regulator [Bacteroidetes bacterium GWE2_40_63]OFY21345.1 MAG: DNA-binding response regulator [Bacteroidetes bacterium GWF2_40_13]OFZ30973.1 MAG: DNA-binding response regulator [Bacteroidetes bacterium RIFOXYC2_FULL_40_12]HAM98273.1 DNA-binding response regulator [Marinilabiliales bacterium]